MMNIYCFHGLGASKKSFEDLEALLSEKHAVQCVDFCGFGSRISEQTSNEPFEFSTEEIFEEIKKQDNLIFIAHSMSSVIALALAEKMQNKVKAIILIEGNLIAEDCQYLSRTLAQATNDSTISETMADLIQQMSYSQYPGWQYWSKDVADVTPHTLKTYSQSLVKASDSEELMSTFRTLNCSKLYIYGDEYADHPIIDMLEGISVRFIENSGHFVMTDKPGETYRAIDSLLKSL